VTSHASVLLVEDDAVAALALRSALVRAGYRVQVASNVDEALGLFVPAAFDVVVTDLVMPGRSGLELLRHVDRSEPLLPVIIVTGDQSVQAAAEAVRGDAFDYLTKPVSGEELLDAVGRAVERRRERRDAEEEAIRRDREHRHLAARHERLASILSVLYDRVPEGIVVIDRDGRILDASASFARLVGASPVTLFDREVSTLFEPHPTEGDLQRLVVRLAAATTTDEGWRGDVGVRAADGRAVPARVSLSVCEAPDAEGGPIRYVVALLFHEVAHEELSEHLQRADRLATIGLLAGSAAHEIKNELGPLVGYLSMVQTSDPGLESMVAAMRDSVRRVQEHVEEILVPLRPRVRARGAVDVRDVVDSVIALLRRAGRLRRIRIEQDAADGVVVLADKDEVHQIALNLLSNAIDALGDGDGGARGRIDVTVRRDSSHGLLEIRDDGVGIEPSMRAHVFEPFFTTKGPSGTGLGLAVVNDIVRTLRGRVSLDCPTEGGTVVTVVVPLYRC
jgi:PAS domain S-box-containing protein